MTGDQHPGIDVDDPWQAIEACFAQDWTDGLPVVPPTAALVERMLAGGPWRADEVLLHEPVRDRAVTAWHAAINAVMAGCRPEYFPVVAAVLSAIGDPDFTLHGPATSTGGAALMVIVNGPVCEAIGLHGGGNLFGPGVRANATIGRALRLVLHGADKREAARRLLALDAFDPAWPASIVHEHGDAEIWLDEEALA